MTTNNQGVGTRELALMILLESSVERKVILCSDRCWKNISICPSRTVHF